MLDLCGTSATMLIMLAVQIQSQQYHEVLFVAVNGKFLLYGMSFEARRIQNIGNLASKSRHEKIMW